MKEECLEVVSKEFCGDYEDSLYKYKTGPQLVQFFNSNFEYDDQYNNGFPTRWFYTSEKIKDIYNNGRINDFFSYIMSEEFHMQEERISRVEIVPFIRKVKQQWNEKLRPYRLQLIQKNDKFELTNFDEDLILIGKGGFADVFLQKSTNLVLKQLKSENLLEASIKHRFKREFDITKGLSDIDGIIKVYRFIESDYSYVMERCDLTLYEYLKRNILSVKVKELIIIKILKIMSEVHKRGIVHRDISPNNIFLKEDHIKISDFGLGKNFNMISSYQTKSTAQLGQIQYCPPEQLMNLKSTGKYSDVFSLGRLINFIFTNNPNDKNHKYKLLVEKATSSSITSRYEDADIMYENFIKIKEFIDDKKDKQEILNLIESKEYNERISMYIYSLSSKDLCNNIINTPNFKYSLYYYFNEYPESILETIKFIELDMDSQCNRFEDADNFADIVNYILEHNLSTFEVREKAAEILNHIAFYINRFHAQRLIKSLIKKGIEPMLEEILQGNKE